MRRVAAAIAIAMGCLLGIGLPAVAVDGDEVGIAASQRGDDGLELLVNVPEDSDLDLDTVRVAVNGTDRPVVVTETRQGGTPIKRTTVLAIDTSNSMNEDGRFAAAKLAARTFVENAPPDVAIGIVTFDSTVDTVLAPVTDRTAALAAIDGLETSARTRLYDGVLAAIAAAGSEGQRSVLLISDGADLGSTASESEVIQSVRDSRVVVDTVALAQADLGTLQLIVGLDGTVLPADPASLSDVFQNQASALSRQLSIAVSLPSALLPEELQVVVTLPFPGEQQPITVDTLVPAVDGGAVASAPQVRVELPPATDTGIEPWVLYGGVAVFGLGLITVLVMLVPARPAAMSAESRVATYAASARGMVVKEEPHAPPLTQQAAEALAGVLRRNRTLDQRITSRLEAAGSELRSSEWVLVHAALFVAFAAVGLLAGRGDIVVGLIFMLLGAVLPWVYLGVRSARRRRAFDSALPETLQLLSGSLSAGLSLMQSVDVIVREGAEPVASAFRRVLVETRIGLSLEDALDGAADRFDSRDFRWVVMAIRIQRQVGGNLAELLNTVAATMREREYMRRQVAALAAEGKLSAVVLSVLPPIFVLYLLVAQRDYIAPLFTDPRGIVMIVGATLWLGVGVVWMSRLVKVEV